MSDADLSLYTGRWLYPRLPHETARELLDVQRARTIEELWRDAAIDHPKAAPAPTGGHPVPPEVLVEVQAGIRGVAVRAGYPRPLQRGREQAFDRPCGTFLFAAMDIVTADAADDGVWSFLGLVLVPEIGRWRFSEGKNDERLLRAQRHVLGRLWWRAWALGPDLDATPDGCTALTEDEFVQIMERPTLGKSRRVARAVRDGVWRWEAGGERASRTEVIRDATRRLRRARSHISLESLTDERLAEVVDQAFAAATAAVSDASPPAERDVAGPEDVDDQPDRGEGRLASFLPWRTRRA